jgi:hypothetical protein
MLGTETFDGIRVWRDRLRTVAALLLGALLLGCGDGGPGQSAGESDDAPAVRAFRDAFEAQQYDRIEPLAADLEAATRDAPDDPALALTLALAHLWGAAEVGRVGGDPVREARHALTTRDLLRRARELAPGDARIDGFIGAVETRIGLVTGDDAAVARGLAEIDRGVERHPEFNRFVRLLVLSRLGRDDPRFAVAVDDVWATLAACGMDVRPDHPTLSLREQPQPSGPDRVCWNGRRALHNFEGFWLYVGDVLVKANEPDLAVALYRNAMAFDSHPEWPFAPLLAARIAEAHDRAARFADADPGNDPEIIADSSVQCAVCHAR